MDWDELLNPLSPYYQDAMCEQQRLVNLQDELISATKKLVASIYPQIYHLESAGYTELDTTIIGECVKLSCKLNEIIAKYYVEE
jgi:hypothetical protein